MYDMSQKAKARGRDMMGLIYVGDSGRKLPICPSIRSVMATDA